MLMVVTPNTRQPASRIDPLEWTQLLSDHRASRGGDSEAPSRAEPHRTPFEADYDRVVYSSPFRRLARKTQVHPLVPHDHVHNRLTHSIEVASVGRTFARYLGAFLRDRDEIDREQAEALCQIVQAACLAHDIGNPPFGHAGEFAVREWVRGHGESMFSQWGHDVPPAVRRDWEMFEGNAQGFRLASRADNPQTGYMRLTYATLATMIKYPWDASDERARTYGKCNVFSTEKTLFDVMADHMGLGRADGTVARHPLSFLAEAADDMCYRTLDLEDAVDMGILAGEDVRQVFLAFLDASESHAPLALLRGQVIRRLIEGCWQVFKADYDAIMAGERPKDLKSDLPEATREALDKVKNLYGMIFAHRTKVATELGAYETLGRIIDVLTQAAGTLAHERDYTATDFLTRRRLDLAWGESYARDHQARPYEWWLHQVMDYVAGLTDNYARQLSREIAGV